MAIASRMVRFEMLEVIEAVAPEGDDAWCPSCALPSGVRITLASKITGQPMVLTTRVRCEDCATMLAYL